MSMGGMMTNESRLAKKMGLRPHVVIVWQIRFGSSKADSIPPGGNTGNHLYGGAGVDNLTGGKWIDYLEGGKDNDILDGGDGPDVLFGGRGDDILKGGEGHDAYLYYSGDGKDTIIDTDALGWIEFNGAVLMGGAGSDLRSKLPRHVAANDASFIRHWQYGRRVA